MAGAGAVALPARAAGERVAIARCMDYGASLMPALRTMMDQIGGLGRIVKGKTVAIKVNLTGSSTSRLSYAPLEHTHWTHPAVVGALVRLMGEAGAQRVRILESAWQTADPLEEVMLEAGWEPGHILAPPHASRWKTRTGWAAPRPPCSRCPTAAICSRPHAEPLL
jgi:hypothetical protein